MNAIDPQSLHANWSYPTRVRFGPGRIVELPDACRALGIARPLLVTDPGLAGHAIGRRVLEIARAGGPLPLARSGQGGLRRDRADVARASLERAGPGPPGPHVLTPERAPAARLVGHKVLETGGLPLHIRGSACGARSQTLDARWIA